MAPEARRRACVEFRVKLSRDTGTNLPAAVCEELLGGTFGRPGGLQVSLQSNPGLFYSSLGAAIATQMHSVVIPNRVMVAWWCCREAAEVYSDPAGMGLLAECYLRGQGVTQAGAYTRPLFGST